MDENLRNFAENDPAFAQFVEQYQLANEDKKTRYRTRMWEKASKMDAYEKMLEKRANIQETKTEMFLAQVLPLLLECGKTPKEIYEKGKQSGVSPEDVRKAMDALQQQQRDASERGGGFTQTP